MLAICINALCWRVYIVMCISLAGDAVHEDRHRLDLHVLGRLARLALYKGQACVWSGLAFGVFDMKAIAMLCGHYLRARVRPTNCCCRRLCGLWPLRGAQPLRQLRACVRAHLRTPDPPRCVCVRE